MRNEQEVVQKLLDYAQNEPRVRAVLMNGSRVNPNAAKDIFCDYDIIFAVTDPVYFLENQEWIANFGELIMMQQNDILEDGQQWYIFLMLFNDGIRIDLSFRRADMINHYLDDSLTKVLLDKENAIRELEPPSDLSYVTHRPSQADYDDITNEFWWCSTNVAKGLWRDELSYAKFMMDVPVRDSMLMMLSWYVGMQHGWCVNTGKAGKWLQKYLPEDIWNSFVRAYAGSDRDEMWDALMEAGRLTRTVGTALADHLGYTYPMEDDTRVTEYLMRVRSLPKDAEGYR